MKQEINVLKVPFFGTELLLVEHNEQPYVVMRNVVEGMGLDWKSQYEKIKQRFNTCMAEITMQLPDDIQRRKLVCFSLRKFPAWLYSIHPNKVSSERKEKIITYQEECDEVLWQYWTTGIASRETVKEKLAEIAELEKLSKQNGSHGSYLMLQRKREKKEIEQRRHQILQYDLFAHFQANVEK